MKKLLPIFCLCLPLFCMAQNPLIRGYDYDASGNRILRKILRIQQAPSAPTDSIKNDGMQPANLSPHTTEYFVEKIAQVEIKIYPNPTTEMITMGISNLENLITGNFKLYTLSGQLLQEHPVHTTTTTISLSGLPNGAYILKVHINDRTEDWKIIKN